MKTGSGKKLVKFEFKGEPRQEVYIAGTFNNWNDKQSKLKEQTAGVYEISLRLSPGKHEYKFIVNGNWCADTNCPDWVPNNQGTFNSVITVA